MKKNLYIDLDGTLAEFRVGASHEELLKKGYFLNLPPIENVVAGVKEFMKRYPEIEVYILSAYISDSDYALQEKISWVDKHIPELSGRTLFVKCGYPKCEIPTPTEDAYLLDDHSPNLEHWEQAGFKGVKLLNGINGSGRKWTGNTISCELSPTEFADRLYYLVKGEKASERKVKELPQITVEADLLPNGNYDVYISSSCSSGSKYKNIPLKAIGLLLEEEIEAHAREV